VSYSPFRKDFEELPLSMIKALHTTCRRRCARLAPLLRVNFLHPTARLGHCAQPDLAGLSLALSYRRFRKHRKLGMAMVMAGIAAAMLVGGVVFWSPSIETRLGRTAVVFGNAFYSVYLASALVIEFTMSCCSKQ
jgi:hypothetical protein